MKINSNITKYFFLFTVSIFFASCLTNVEEDGEVIMDSCADITFSAKIKPIIDANCVECHRSGGNSPNLTTYTSINLNSNNVKEAVASRRMPQGTALAQEDIDAIVCWVNAGALNN
jgi:uncharacterized membrane protein